MIAMLLFARSKNHEKKYGIICLVLILGFIFLPRLTVAQSPGLLESRIARIEAEIFSCDRK
jgi:hypothetical protein